MGLVGDFETVFDMDGWVFVNLSFPAMGNRYITSRLFEYVEYNGVPDYVYLQYSGLNRIDLPFDINFKVPNYVFQSNFCEKYPWIPKSKKHNWVASGARAGIWTSNDLLNKIFTYMYDLDDETCTHDVSLHEIFRGIEFCKKMNISYNWSTYYDYTKNIHRAVEKDGLTAKMPDYIDMTNHVGESPLNVGFETGNMPDGGRHYGEKVSRLYLKRNKNKFNL